jgi:hypothetical protein
MKVRRERAHRNNPVLTELDAGIGVYLFVFALFFCHR